MYIFKTVALILCKKIDIKKDIKPLDRKVNIFFKAGKIKSIQKRRWGWGCRPHIGTPLPDSISKVKRIKRTLSQ